MVKNCNFNGEKKIGTRESLGRLDIVEMFDPPVLGILAIFGPLVLNISTMFNAILLDISSMSDLLVLDISTILCSLVPKMMEIKFFLKKKV